MGFLGCFCQCFINFFILILPNLCYGDWDSIKYEKNLLNIVTIKEGGNFIHIHRK